MTAREIPDGDRETGERRSRERRSRDQSIVFFDFGDLVLSRNRGGGVRGGRGRGVVSSLGNGGRSSCKEGRRKGMREERTRRGSKESIKRNEFWDRNSGICYYRRVWIFRSSSKGGEEVRI